MGKYFLAIDIGASSGRHILGHVEDGKIILEEVHRFDNKQVHRNGHDCWDMDNLWSGIVDGLKACKALGKIPNTIGIDTWAVDYVLLDGDGHPLGDAVAYRDGRTQGMDGVVDAIIPRQELYARTGIQYQTFNTIYQLAALNRENPEQLAAAENLLMIPDYFNYKLTGVKKQEYTNATSTNLVNAAEKTWDMELIGRLGMPAKLFGELSMPGTVVGELTEEIQKEVGFNATVILPATHDTGSAFLAVPARDENAVYLSSGTWSLLGVENEEPITTEESRQQNFTNEGGAWYRFRYLKNIMGLWMIQSIRRELNGVAYVAGRASKYATGRTWSFPDRIDAARSAADFPSVVDANDDSFLAPDSMIDAIKAYCEKSAQPVPQTVGEIMQCVYRSLAKCYKDAIVGLSALTGKTYTSINIVGGGCQDICRHTRVDETAVCHGLTIRGTELEELIYEVLSKQAQIILNLDDLSNAGQLDVQLAEQAESNSRIKDCQDEKRALYERFVLKEISIEEYKSQKAAIEIELDRLRAIYSALETQTARMQMDEQTKSARAKLAQEVAGANGLTAGMADTLIDRVYVYPGNRVEIVWKMKDFCV